MGDEADYYRNPGEEWDEMNKEDKPVGQPSKQIEEKAKAYIEAVIALSKGYGLSIGHQDSQGAFEIQAYNPHYDKWLRDANIEATDKDNIEVNNYEI